MQRSYDQMNIHVHQAISDLIRVTGMAIADAILAGERDPARLTALADRRIKASSDTLIKALRGDWRPDHLFTLQQAPQTHAHYQQLIDRCDQQIQAAIRALQTAPGEPANAPCAGAGGAGEPTSEGEAPTAPTASEFEPFVMSSTSHGCSAPTCHAFLMLRTLYPGRIPASTTRSPAAG